MDLAELKEAGIRALSDSLLSSIGFIDSLREQGYNKVAFIRLDLLVKRDMPREQVDDYLTHLRSVIRRQQRAFTHCLGLIRTSPIQEEVEYRIQCVLIFDGESERNVIQRGHDVGRYWVNSVTAGQGRYRNFNQHRQLHGVVSGLGGIRTDVPSEMGWLSFQLGYGMGPVGWPLTIVGVPHGESPARP